MCIKDGTDRNRDKVKGRLKLDLSMLDLTSLFSIFITFSSGKTYAIFFIYIFHSISTILTNNKIFYSPDRSWHLHD